MLRATGLNFDGFLCLIDGEGAIEYAGVDVGASLERDWPSATGRAVEDAKVLPIFVKFLDLSTNLSYVSIVLILKIHNRLKPRKSTGYSAAYTQSITIYRTERLCNRLICDSEMKT